MKAYIDFFCRAKRYDHRQKNQAIVGEKAEVSTEIKVDNDKHISLLTDEDGIDAWEDELGEDLQGTETFDELKEIGLLPEEELKIAAKNEFEEVLPKWLWYASSIDWVKEFPMI